MRLPRRVLSSLHGVLAFLLLAGFVFPLSAQSPATKSDSLPAKWNDAVTALAEKIAGASGAARTLSIEMRNISSLSSAEASGVKSALVAELKQRGLRIVASTRASAEVNLTLSESADVFVWVAEIIRGDSRKVVMVPASKVLNSAGGENRSAVLLEKSLVWEQPGKFLDFAILPGRDVGVNRGVYVEGPDRLVILEPDQLIYYSLIDEDWKFDRAIPIPRAQPLPRDVRGFIDPGAQIASLKGAQCTGNLTQPQYLICTATKSGSEIRPGASVTIPGYDGEDAALTGLYCGGAAVALGTGLGDWTQPDLIQAFVATSGEQAGSGASVQLAGPVMSLAWTGVAGRLQAVVHNLKTGNYEAYIVTATCSH